MSVFADGILNGRVAFVTGGGTGITGGVARALSEAGARVALISRKMEHLEPAAERIRARGGEAFAVAADVRNYDEVERAIAATVEKFGHVEMSANAFGSVVDIDLKGTFNVCRSAFSELKKHSGQILNISATLHYVGTPLQLHVSAAKAGVDALTRQLAVEWGRYRIRSNAIAPGPIEDTEGMQRLVPPEIKERLLRSIPVGRFGRIKDIEHAAVFLCSEAASFINGAVIVVDGGQWLASGRTIEK
ncbi:MAG: hypothetical protein AUG51_07930 [Acidobacteria bacterium 13_1_20CM_3_53_8]|nr:MAG: hypothetical protein AUG51_07930 [Acidobacteria bacterium 13_1_20CM_3_53_8]